MGISLWARGSFSIQDSACAISTEHHENQNWPSPHPSAGLDLSETVLGNGEKLEVCLGHLTFSSGQDNPVTWCPWAFAPGSVPC